MLLVAKKRLLKQIDAECGGALGWKTKGIMELSGSHQTRFD
jgi:hypothetical protein